MLGEYIRFRPWLGYLVALIATASTLGLRLAINARLEGHPTLVIFTVPIMLSAYLGGLRAGIAATTLTYAAASYFLLPPLNSFSIESEPERWQLFFVAFAGIFISILNESLHRTRRRADAATMKHKEGEISAARLAAIVDSSDDAIVGKDLNGIVTSWNHGAEMLFGFSESQMVGRSITTLIPEDRQGEEGEILSRIRTGESVRHFETVRLRKDAFPIDVSVTVSAIRNAKGEIIGASKVARDISEQKKQRQ